MNVKRNLTSREKVFVFVKRRCLKHVECDRDIVKGEQTRNSKDAIVAHLKVRKGTAVPQHTYEEAGGSGRIAPTHSRPRY
jgi:hypothetical protein